MHPRIDLISIVTNRLEEMVSFYHEVIGFEIELKMENYVEFSSENVRFAITTNKVMYDATGDERYSDGRAGQTFELAFPVPTPAEVDVVFAELVEKGAVSIKPPEDMPWNQRAGFFADPDGNIHELFADLPE